MESRARPRVTPPSPRSKLPSTAVTATRLELFECPWWMGFWTAGDCRVLLASEVRSMDKSRPHASSKAAKTRNSVKVPRSRRDGTNVPTAPPEPGARSGREKEQIMDLDGKDRIQRLITRPVVYVHVNDTLRAIAITLIEESVGAALVRGPHGTIGLVTERDIVRALAEGAGAKHTTAADIMAEQLVTVAPGDDLLDAVHRMLDNEVRHLPVIDDGVPAGMISARDAMRALAEEQESSV